MMEVTTTHTKFAWNIANYGGSWTAIDYNAFSQIALDYQQWLSVTMDCHGSSWPARYGAGMAHTTAPRGHVFGGACLEGGGGSKKTKNINKNRPYCISSPMHCFCACVEMTLRYDSVTYQTRPECCDSEAFRAFCTSLHTPSCTHQLSCVAMFAHVDTFRTPSSTGHHCCHGNWLAAWLHVYQDSKMPRRIQLLIWPIIYISSGIGQDISCSVQSACQHAWCSRWQTHAGCQLPLEISQQDATHLSICVLM